MVVDSSTAGPSMSSMDVSDLANRATALELTRVRRFLQGSKVRVQTALCILRIQNLSLIRCLTGPYGNLQHLGSEYQTLVLCAGGSGVS